MSRQSDPSQPPLRLLSLDGGGVRGYSMLLLLQEVMVKLFAEMEGRAPKRWEIPRPCDHFDLIGGTGTGGLIAILLGRLRLDIDTALELYVDLTRRVFETDKTVAGVPYRKTLFKASKLEEAIKEVAKIYESADTTDHRRRMSPTPTFSSSSSRTRRSNTLPHLPGMSRSMNGSMVSMESYKNYWQPQSGPESFSNEDALLYDERPGRCKTFLTGVYRGSHPGSPPALLRTYDSPAESSPSGTCRIWEAGRATCATFPAFKSIQIGQNVFLDEGPGKFNPAPLVIEEAMVNEWPGREIGIIVSIGSGKRPSVDNQSVINRSSVRTSMISATPLQKFVDAKEQHIQKIEDCEEIHNELRRSLRSMSLEEDNYFRLNVDMGVGEAGMNAYNEMAMISTYTRTYLARANVQRMNQSCAEKLAAIHRQKHRVDFRGLKREILDKGLPSLPTQTQKISPTHPLPPTTTRTFSRSESRIQANIADEFDPLPRRQDRPSVDSNISAVSSVSAFSSIPRRLPGSLESTYNINDDEISPRTIQGEAPNYNYSSDNYTSTSRFSSTSTTSFSGSTSSTTLTASYPTSANIIDFSFSDPDPSTVADAQSISESPRSSMSSGPSSTTPSSKSQNKEDMDDEVARHLEELQRIAVKIQAEAHWTAERDYFRPESRAASAASTAGSQRSGRHSVRSEPRVERSARSDTRAEREHAYTDHPQKQYQAYKPMQPPRAFTTGTTSAHPPNGLAMTTGSGPAARKRQPIKPKSNWVPPANWDAKRVA